MSERRRQRASSDAGSAGATRDDVPECLRAGRCIEVWAPDGLNAMTAWRRHRTAEQRWRQLHGIGEGEHNRVPRTLTKGAPWSFEFLARTPDRLERQLHHCGLPLAWTPVPAPEEWL